MTEQERVERLKKVIFFASRVGGPHHHAEIAAAGSLAALRAADPGLARYFDATPEQRAAVERVLAGKAVAVPLKPTSTMLNEGGAVIGTAPNGARHVVVASQAWAAMLAASPHAISSGDVA